MENQLNSAQKQAVEHLSGPLLIVAGAGTGKTSVITSKIAHLINSQLAKPEEILALTFTDSAAEEMVARVDGLINTGYAEMQISTFHAFAQKILADDGINIGLPSGFKLATDSAAWQILNQNLYELELDYFRPLGNPTKNLKSLLHHFSKCKDELIEPADYLKLAEETKLNGDNTDEAQTLEIKRLNELANTYHHYNRLLLQHSMLDFGDLIFYANKLFETRPNILKKYQTRFKYILVDEFQDVNWAQYELVKKIAGAGNGLTVVGDDDQSIYAFRGASVSNIMRFKDDFPEARNIVLTENYRSGQNILNTAYKLIQNNNPDRLEVKLNIEKRLISKADKPNEVVHLHSETLDEEVKSVIDEIARLKTIDPDTSWDDFAILVRANSHAEPFLSAMENRGIPYEFLTASGLYRQPIVLDAINFLRLTDNYHESFSVYRLLCLPFLKFPPHDLQKINHFAHKLSLSLYEALKRINEIGLEKESVDTGIKIFSLINSGTENAKENKPTMVLYDFLEKSGYLAYLTHAEGEGNEKIIKQIYHLKQIFDQISEFESLTAGATVKSFLEHFHMLTEAGEQGKLYRPDETPESVNVMTIHSSKGLEYRYVFIVNMVEQRFPSTERNTEIEIPELLVKEQLPEGDSHLQEERRLFYVALTRGKERVYLTSASDYGGKRGKKISRFLNELGFQVETKLKTKIKLSLPNVVTAEKQNKTYPYQLPGSYSFSQLRAYETCPYQYKLAHILKIPTRGSSNFSFGKSLHNTLQEFYLRIQELNHTEQTSLFSTDRREVATIKVPTLEELLSMYQKNWIPDWYKNSEQREERFNQGKEIVKNFYKEQENKWTIPEFIESDFTLKIGDYLLRGKIDRVDRLPDGTLEIIDYKTGESKEELKSKDKEQLYIYQIAAAVTERYSHLGTVSKLTFFYLNDQTSISFLGDTKALNKLQENIKKTLDEVSSLEFTAAPSKFNCSHCDFKEICEYRE